MLSVEDWAEIRRLHRAERMPIKVIARVLGCSKNTVKKALVADQPPTYRRHSRGSVVDPMEPRIRELLQAMRRVPRWSLDFEALDCDGDAAVVVADQEIARLQGPPG